MINLPELYKNNFRSQPLIRPNSEPATRLVRTRLEPERRIHIRPIEMQRDWEFIEELQKPIRKQVGFWTPGTVRGYIKKGGALIAEFQQPAECVEESSAKPTIDTSDGEKLGFIFFTDTYRRQDNLGAIYQVNVRPDTKRNLVGAKLVQAAFEAMPYGVRLCCCWCAQDLPANSFWESLGFVPLAFRTGARNTPGEERIHIFWQRRVCINDSLTPYWYPYKTTGGQMNEQRLVLPIPPGMSWRDAALPAVLPDQEKEKDPESKVRGELEGQCDPQEEVTEAEVSQSGPPKTLAELRQREAIAAAGEMLRNKDTLTGGQGKKEQQPVRRSRVLMNNGRPVSEVCEQTFDDPHITPEALEAAKKFEQQKKKKKKKKTRNLSPNRIYLENEIDMTREFRDRYLEAVNEQMQALPPAGCGKWDVSRQLEGAQTDDDREVVDAELTVRETLALPPGDGQPREAA